MKTDIAENVGVHVFEKAGLGKAPFRFVGMYRDVGPKQMGDGLTCGAPGQPMGTCDYCGTGIADCCSIRSSDGKTFIVGTTCVNKTGDAGLIKAYKSSPEYREQMRQQRVALATKKRQEIKRLMAEHEDLLRSLPHPKGFTEWGTNTPLTAYDYVDWMVQHSGAAGRHRLLQWLRKEVA